MTPTPLTAAEGRRCPAVGGLTGTGITASVSTDGSAIKTRPYRILITDDSPEDRETYRRRIAQGREQDYLFWETGSGEEGLELYRSVQPDCVVLDYNLPDLDGLEILARLRSEQGDEPLPVVMLTGQGNETVAVQALKAGAQDYLVKNRAGEGLRHAIHATMEKVALRRQVDEQRRELERAARALRESDERSRLMIESLVDYALYMLDPEGRIVSWNTGAERIMGYEAQEVVGRHFSLFYTEEEIRLDHPERALKVAVAEGRFEDEGYRVRKDGSHFWANNIIAPLYNAAGQVRGFSKVTRDVTERKRAEEALVERARLASLGADVGNALTRGGAFRDSLRNCAQALVRHLDAAFARIWTLNPAGDVLELQASAGMYTHTDGPHGRVPVGHIKIGLIARERRPYLTNAVIGDPRVGDQEWAEREGMVAFAGYPLMVEDRLVGVMALFARRPLTEVTLQSIESVAHEIALGIEQRQAMESLRESEGRFRQLAESIREVFFMTTPDMAEILYVSPAYEDVWGRTCQSLYEVPLSWSESIPAEDRRRVIDSFTRQFQAGEVWEDRYRVVRPDGSIRRIWARGFPVRNEHGEVYRVAGIAEDATERDLAQEQIHELNAQLGRRLEQLGALRRIDMAITASLDQRLTLDTLLDQTVAQLEVDAACILLLDPHALTLTYAAGRGFFGRSISRSQVRLGESFAGRAALERHMLVVPDLAEVGEAFAGGPLLAAERFVSYYGVPLVAKGQVKGVLEVFHRAALAPEPEWLDFLEALAGQAAIAVDNASLFEGLQRSNVELTLAYDATIEGWSRALDLRDKETEGHTRRVTEMSLCLARAMGIDGIDFVNMRRGALLHDIGKMGIPDAILLKPGPLTDEEWTVMRLHPTYAHDWLSPIGFLRPALDIPHGHHEKWDGTGYPRGLKGDQIPMAARIFAVADIWDALRSDRPYRQGWPEDRVREHIRSLAGTHLDPVAVAVFLQVTSAPDPVSDL